MLLSGGGSPFHGKSGQSASRSLGQQLAEAPLPNRTHSSESSRGRQKVFRKPKVMKVGVQTHA